jgi:putative transposase
MSANQYDPQIHHRRSIRLKQHNYAGGGAYFVTICAHRDAGDIFADPSVTSMVGRVWEELPKSPVGASLVDARKEEGTHEGCLYVVMPDHFHALVQMRVGEIALGDIVGAFKSLVVHGYIAGVKAGRFAPFPGKIWHRNYYERIVRTPKDAEKIAEYIRMNPWRCVTDFGNGLRGMGNPALWNVAKLGVLCSRNAPRPKTIPNAAAYLGGFHSPMEKEIFAKLLELKKPLIWCPAWGLGRTAFAPGVREALEQNRMLILEMRNRDGDLAAAEQRNRFVLSCADKRWIPHVSRGGMLERLMQEYAAIRSSTIRPLSSAFLFPNDQ